MLVVSNILTKIVPIVPTSTNCTAVAVAELYRDHVFDLHGVPTKVLGNQDLRFMSASQSFGLFLKNVKPCELHIILRLMIK